MIAWSAGRGEHAIIEIELQIRSSISLKPHPSRPLGLQIRNIPLHIFIVYSGIVSFLAMVS